MTITTRFFILSLAVLAGLAAAPASASACKCPLRTPDQTQAYADGAQGVFLGKVTAVDYKTKRVTFAVEKAWKGIAAKTVSMDMDFKDSDCGWYAFVKGREYLVFTASDGLKIAPCSPTRTRGRNKDFQDYLDRLGEPPAAPAQ